MAALQKKEEMSRNTSNHYNNGSTAPSVQTWEYPDAYPETLPKKPPQAKPGQSKAEIKQKALYHIRFLLTAVAVCTCCITMMIFNSTIVESRRNINSLNSDLRDIKLQNSTLKADISEQLDLKYIEKLAVEKLNMAKPNKYQIVYIDVPKSNYTIQHDKTKPEDSNKENTLLVSIKALMNGIFSRKW